MKKLLLLVVAAVAVNYLYPNVFAPVRNAIDGLWAVATNQKPAAATKWTSVPKTFSFTDVSGRTYSFAGDTNKPTVVAFWIGECGYSQNAMHVLNALRREYPEEKLDVIGVFLNYRAPGDVINTAHDEGYFATLVAAQPGNEPVGSVPLIKTMHEGFGIRGPGRDIYVIDSRGGIHVIPAVTSNDDRRMTEEIIIKVEDVLKEVLSRA